MRNYRLILEYDGTDFAGFQYQTGQRTVQNTLEEAISKLAHASGRVAGAGRTDAGVHALGQVASFWAELSVPANRLASALNSLLPGDLSVVAAAEAEAGFHARYSAVSRRYLYIIRQGRQRSGIWDRYSWRVGNEISLAAMKAGSRFLIGEMDFATWGTSTCRSQSTVRQVKEIKAGRRGRFVLIWIEANGFLKHMVRRMVGTLVEVGLGRRDPQDIQVMTHRRDIRLAGPVAPAAGLCLLRVRYQQMEWDKSNGDENLFG
ncbi:MAG: tRNA pseudouridine(38-40) synthase TruA [Armatimonadetes bacterium]|nr:tRNA pseudouridine(38-40) synthase TruA [Armatimonadota bacterium]